MKEAVKRSSQTSFDEGRWNQFGQRLFYLQGNFQKDEDYSRLKEKVDRIGVPFSGAKHLICYMAVPPQVVPLTVGKMKDRDLCSGPYNMKIIVEKPFGEDRKSAAELNRILIGAFDENEIYRIDHYLAKEPVDNIIFFRFSNTIFEEVWNRRYVDNVQITVAEDIGIEHRGAFYEKAGVVRDIVQNHLLQSCL